MLERLEGRELLAAAAPTFGLSSSVVATANDFFAIEKNQPLNYNSASDLVRQGLDDTGLINANVANGQYNFTTGAAPQIYFHHPGAGATPEETTGETIPIDASKYYLLNFKLTVDPLKTDGSPVADPETQAAAGPQASVTFYRGPIGNNGGTFTTVGPVLLHPGTFIYSLDLRNMSQFVSNAGNWTGLINGVRFNPSNQTGVTMHLDWVTLTGASQTSVNANITGVRQAQIALSTDNNPAHAIKLVEVLSSDLTFFSQQLVPTTTFSGPIPVDLSALQSGVYYLHALDANGAVLANTTGQPITVNNTPLATILTPNAVGDLSTDYASRYRTKNLNALTPDPWDFAENTDFTVPDFVIPNTNPTQTDPAGYGVPTIVTNPQTQLFGQLAGPWLRYDNQTATRAPNDAQFLFNLGAAPIDATRYKNLTYTMVVDRTRDVGEGAVARIAWSDSTDLGPGLSHFNQSLDIIDENGLQTYHINMATLPVGPGSPGQNAWGSFPSAGKPGDVYTAYLRFDPTEYPTPAVSYIGNVTLTQNFKTVNGLFTITWNAANDVIGNLTDGNGQPVTITSIQLDPDRTYGNGNEITIPNSASANTGSFTFNTASIPNLAAGSYNVVLNFSNSTTASHRYSTGQLDVNPLPARANIPFYRAYNPSPVSPFHFYTTSLGEFNNAVAHGFNDESTTQGVPFFLPNNPGQGAMPLHRMYNPNNGQHYYTTSDGERDSLRYRGFLYETDEAYIYPLPSANYQPPAGTSEVFLLYSNNNGDHLFTVNAAQRDAILKQFPGIWVQQTSLGYAFPTAGGSAAPSLAAEHSAPSGAVVGAAASSGSATSSSGTANAPAAAPTTLAGLPVAPLVQTGSNITSDFPAAMQTARLDTSADDGWRTAVDRGLPAASQSGSVDGAIDRLWTTVGLDLASHRNGSAALLGQ